MRHLFKKLIVWTLCLAMAVGMLPGLARGAKALEPDAGASAGIAWNEEKGYYEISSYEGLLEFARIVNGIPAQFQNDSAANAKIVVEEIDALVSNPKNLGYDAQTTAWTPIGNYSSPYTGTFDGNGCTITGLTIESKNNYIGLFGYVGKGGSVENVGLVEGSITGENYVGGVVGFNGGTVSKCYNTGKVTGTGNSVGGVVGNNSFKGTVSECYNNGDVEGNDNVGGVVGKNEGTVENCYNTGAVRSKSGNYVGGVAGDNYNTVSNCYNTGDVSGSGHVGGVAGDNYGAVSNCYNTGDVEGRLNDVGGVAGDNDGIVSGCHNTGKVTGIEFVGGVVGNNTGKVSNCYNTRGVTGNGSTVGGVVGSNEDTVSNCSNIGAVEGSGNYVGGVVGDNRGTVEECHNTGAVSGENENNGGGDYVGGVVGSNDFHGEVSSCYNSGAVSGVYDVGGVVGWNYGTVSNCYNTSIVGGSGVVGGVVGWNKEDTVSYCYNTGAVSGGFDVGGVAGRNSGKVSNCYNSGEVTGSNIRIGGVVGSNNESATVSNCYNIGAVGEGDCVGGVVGSNSSRVLNCYNTGKVTGSDLVGSLVGFNHSEEPDTSPCTVLNCYYNKSICQIGAIYGFDDASNYGLTTLQMIGTVSKLYDSLKNIEEDEKPVWLFRMNIDGTYYYPHLAGFNSDKDGKQLPAEDIPADEWPNKGTFAIALSDDQLTYTGDTFQVEKVTLDNKEITEYKAAYLDSSDKEIAEPKDAGVYRVCVYWEEKGISRLEKSFEILPASVTLTANSATVTYDGTAKTVSGYTCSVDGLPFDGATAGVSATKAGTYEVAFAGVTLEKTTDTTGNYKVSKTENGTLTINKKPLTITADSDTKEFDGEALTKDSVTTTALAEGDKLESITITGTQTDVGTTDNVPSSAKIVNAAGEDVTGCYDITYVNGTLTVTKPAAPKLADDQKPAPKQDLKEDGKEQVLVLDPAKLPEGYTIEYSTDGGKTWKAAPTGTQSGEYTIEVKYTADGNHTDFFGDTLKVMIQGVYNKTESDGDWTKGSGKTYTFRIKKAFNDEVCFDNFTGVLVDGKQAQPGKDYTAVKGSTVITFAADYLETLAVGEHMIRVVFKDGEILLPLKILEAVATPTPAVDATPVTGDTVNPFLFVALILVSMAGAAVIIERRRHSTGI